MMMVDLGDLNNIVSSQQRDVNPLGCKDYVNILTFITATFALQNCARITQGFGGVFW
jgi:hypothetical protein